jgi:hypothetical protein
LHGRSLDDKAGYVSFSQSKPETFQGDPKPLEKGESLQTSWLNQIPVLQEQQDLPSQRENWG